MNIIEPESNSLISLYKQRLSTLGSTISSLHTKVSLDQTVALLQSNDVLQKYHKQRINELVKQIIEDERQLILISCLQQYHKLKVILQQNKAIQQNSSINNQQKKKYVQVINKKDNQLLELNSLLNRSKQQIQQLKSQINNSTLQTVISSEYSKNFEIQKLSLQSITNSLTFENHRLVQDNVRLREITKELEYQIGKKEQKDRQQIEDLIKQVKKLQLQNQEKTKELLNTKNQLKQAEDDSLTQKIYLSDKFSQLPRNRSLHTIKPNTRYLPRNKFRVAQFQQLCYQMSKQEQQLRNIRSNFAKFGQVLQREFKTNLQNLRKTMIGIKSMIQSQLKDSKLQMIKFTQIFQTKASKILANQRTTQTQKMERMKNLYQEQRILMQEKMKMQQIETQKKIKDAQLKIKDERIDQLQLQINNIKQVQNQYKQLVMQHQMLQAKLRLTSQPSSHRIKLESPRSFSPPPLDRLQISPPTNPSILNYSKSLSPKTIIKNYAPSSPQVVSRAHFNTLQYSRNYNPQLQFESDNLGKDSRTRKQLQNGFNELEQEIQAIIERRNKRNMKNSFRFE